MTLRHWLRGGAALAVCLALAAPGPARAAVRDEHPSTDNNGGNGAAADLPATPQQDNGPIPDAEADKPLNGPFFERGALLGDPGGIRHALISHGITLSLAETDDLFGNATGGTSRQLVYEGLTQMGLKIDLGKLAGLEGGTFNATAFQIHGRGLSSNALANINTSTSIEADRATRLFELWYQQELFGGKADIRIGQQAADQEFLISQYSNLFINSGFGWPNLPGVDLPTGGPAYPFATPAVRLRVQPTEALTVLVGVFNGAPAGLTGQTPQLADPSGTRFGVGDGYMVIAEAQYAINSGKGATGLPGVYKIGALYNSDAFTNQFYDAAIPETLFTPHVRRGDWSVYGVADQLIYRTPGTDDGGLGVFLRAETAPGDRNLIDAFLSAGATFKGMPGRPDDTVGFGVLWTRISDTARMQDLLRASAGAYVPQRGSETVLELTYQAQFAPWWQVQPDLQYVLDPAGGIENPNNPGHKVKDELILGLRSTVTF